MKVTAILVTHNGERWLPRVLEALGASAQLPDRLVAVDTGSTDNSVDLVARALGRAPLELPSDTGFGSAVTAALESAPSLGEDEWVWLLHDDSAPGPRCLGEMIAAAENAEQSTVALGPKLREWPTLRRLLEVGVTVTGTGRRETGLEPGEPDQGQHDRVDRVLAVNTAGMLVRRDVLEYFGFSPELPLFANDLDFGWRLAARSLQTRVVPTAVMFHAEASYRGRRDAELARHHRRDARAAEMFVVLANGSRRWHAVRLVRMFLSGILRAFGFSLVRAFGEARAELAALRMVYGPSRRHHRARRARQAAASAPSSELRGLLAPVWMPWRHGLDFVIDFVRAVAAIAADRARERLAEESAKGPLAPRILRSPTSYALAIVFLVALIAEHGLMGPGSIAGGALLPAPSGPGHWWSLWWSSWHWVGGGSSVAGPPYALPMAFASSIAFGQPGLIIWLIFGMGVPLAGLGAWRFAARLGVGPWAQAWACLTYALVPVALGALSNGHLGTMVVAILLPWIGRAALGLGSPSPEMRERSVWRLVLVGGLAATFAPVLALMLVVFALVASWLGATVSLRQRIVIALAPLLLILPWLVTAVRVPGSVLMEAGAAATSPSRLGPLDLVTGSLPGSSQVSVWLLLGIPLAALAALVRPATRALVLRCWAVAAFSAVVAVIYAWIEINLPGRLNFVPYLGIPLLIQIAALIVAAVGATPALREAVMESSFGVRQMLVAGLTLFAVLAPVSGIVVWLGTADNSALQGGVKTVTGPHIPAYIAEAAATSNTQATLVITGGSSNSRTPAISYLVQRSPVVLGDDSVLALTSEHKQIGQAISDILSGHAQSAASTLAASGISYVYAPSPVAPLVAGSFDIAAACPNSANCKTPSFSNAYTPNLAARAWQVTLNGNESGLAKPGALGAAVHRWFVLVQLLALLIVVVLAAPGRATEGEGESAPTGRRVAREGDLS